MQTTTATAAATDPVPTRRTWRELLPWASLAGRLVLAGVMGYAAVTKIGDPADTVRAVRAYKLLPEGVAVPFAHALPWFELALAALLLIGLAVRFAGVVATVLMVLFVAGISSAWMRGLKIDCGCFGGGGPNPDPKYATELFRDGALTAVALLVALVPRSKHALDPELPAPPPPPPADSSTVSRRQRQQLALEAARREKTVLRRRNHTRVAMAIMVASALLGIAVGAAATPGKPASAPAGTTKSGGIVVGSASAPRLLVIYEDPQCPVCERFERTSGAVLTEAVTRGLVRVEYRMRSFIGPESVRAVAALGAAADEGKFEPFREQIFAHQPPERTGGYTVDDLLSLGSGVGLTSDTFVDAVRKQKYAGWAKRIDDQASRAGNVGTPELILDGKTVPMAMIFEPVQFAALFGLKPAS